MAREGLRIFVLVTFSVCFIVVCESLKMGKDGVCQVEIAVKKTRSKPYLVTSNRWCGKKKCTYRKTKIETYIEKRPTPTCCEGWEYIQSNDTCKPQCRLGCEGGTCTAPDNCTCEPPLALQNHTCVAPKCDNACINGRCIGENTCSCDDGLHAINATHCGPTCLPGYGNDELSLECVPQCTQACINGNCTSPDTCTCLHGYKQTDELTCIPECRPAWVVANCTSLDLCTCFVQDSGCCCLNNVDRKWMCSDLCDLCNHGQCVGPDTCVCDEGYSRKQYACTPDCSKNCTNGFCSEPDVCTCDPGYDRDPNDKFNCLPICEPECINATCTAPNRCTCMEGYGHLSDLKSCEPICEGCEKGQCVAPDTCVCDEGYSKKNGSSKCTPHCDNACLNGTCTKPNTCSCDGGYEIDVSDKFRCVPTCQPKCVNGVCVAPSVCKCADGYETTNESSACRPKCEFCEHGTCIAPNLCKCDEGYVSDARKCIPFCSRQCVNGKCVAPDKCSCHEGYEKLDSKSHVCGKPCSCGNGTCSLEGECICEFGFELVNGSTCRKILIEDCKDCERNCTKDLCCCNDSSACCFKHNGIETAKVTSSARMASLELVWLAGAALVFLLMALVLIVMQRIWHKTKRQNAKGSPDTMNAYGSVIYTVPDTLMRKNEIYKDNFAKYEETDPEASEDKETAQQLLSSQDT